ncbi:MAG: hypothetical protein RO257_06950 [Candidatus Kapabacteria bacterium]|nr:hypothetical protein [Candidatus Kapabacteria bacterium]
MIIKDDLIELTEKLPEEIELDEIIDSLFLLNKIDTGLRQSESGDVFSLNEVKEIVSKW